MSVRARLTVTAMLVVGIALAAGAWILVLQLGASLTGQACDATRDRAVTVARQATPSAIQATPDEIVQLINANSSAAALDHGAPGECRKVEPPGRGEDYAVVAEPVAGQDGALVIVAHPLVDVLESTHFVTRVLAIGLPVVLALVGLTTWYVVGRSLAPVAAIRAEADRITAADLSRRVPSPPSRDEVARLAGTINRMLERLQRAQDEQRRFVSDASHELRSPIAAIRQYAEVALAHPDRLSVVDLATPIHAENLRLQALVDDLLILARSDEGMLHLRTALLDLDDLVFEEASHQRESTQLRVDTSAVSVGRVRGDQDALRRVLRNLGDNAASNANETIAFGLAQQNGHVVLTVSDDGPGIPAGDREHVFDRFVRLTGSRSRSRDEGGSGLGLAIVSELVAAHGGTVRADASPLGGARLEVRLPASGG